LTRLEVCSLSGYKIYQGRGRRFVRADGKIFQFLNHKSESLFQQRKNPRKLNWTAIYRRMHRKGTIEEIAKRRTRRAVKTQRPIVGASMELLQARRLPKPEIRAAARAKVLQAAKKEVQEKKTTTKVTTGPRSVAQPRQEKPIKVVKTTGKPSATSR
jgi:large subunit ribosomal protein L24e